MVGEVVRRSTPFRGLRRFEPASDLGQMADLIRVAFAEELDPVEINVLQEMRTLELLAPVLWLFNRISPEFQDAFGGFVWIEDGRLVGNVTVTRSGLDTRLWLVSNVAVDPAYRRRGIAHDLMAAALDHVRAREGHAVHLQVRRNNVSAQALYRKFGFVLLDSNTDLRLNLPGPVDVPPAPGFQLSPWDAESGPRAFELARAVVPAAWQHLQTLEPRSFEPPGPMDRLAEWLRGRYSRRWAIVEGDDFVATLVADAAWRSGVHRLKLTVRPDWRGRVEDHLVVFALAQLREMGDRPVEATVPTEHAAAVDALRRCGFAILRSLDRMGVELVPRIKVSVHAGSRD